jgi:porphyrinogen peroxidase
MSGNVSGTRDALTGYARPLTGSYYFVPSTESIRQHVLGEGSTS